MPYPAYADTSFGIALVRSPAGADTWTHVAWVKAPFDVVVDTPGSGNFDYRYIQVHGAATAGAVGDVFSVLGRQMMTVTLFKR